MRFAFIYIKSESIEEDRYIFLLEIESAGEQNGCTRCAHNKNAIYKRYINSQSNNCGHFYFRFNFLLCDPRRRTGLCGEFIFLKKKKKMGHNGEIVYIITMRELRLCGVVSARCGGRVSSFRERQENICCCNNNSRWRWPLSARCLIWPLEIYMYYMRATTFITYIQLKTSLRT